MDKILSCFKFFKTSFQLLIDAFVHRHLERTFKSFRGNCFAKTVSIRTYICTSAI